MSCTLKVSEKAMERAISVANSIERTIFSLLPTGMTAEGFAVSRVEQRVHDAGAAGISQSELTRAFWHDKQKNLVERLKMLQQSGRVFGFERSTAGRPAGIFLHCEFLAEHQKDFPNDVGNVPSVPRF